MTGPSYFTSFKDITINGVEQKIVPTNVTINPIPTVPVGYGSNHWIELGSAESLTLRYTMTYPAHPRNLIYLSWA